MNVQSRAAGFGVAALTLFSVQMASASVEATFGFKAITNNETASVDIAEAQFFVDLIDTGVSGEVRFDFSNVGPDRSVIGQIYFEEFSDPLASTFKLFDGFLGLIDADNGGDAGVDFSQDIPNNPNGNNTPNLPSANSAIPPFEATLGFAADADSPAGFGGNSIDPGETLGILFSLVDGLTVADVKDALDLAILDPTKIGTEALTLRIGIHGQGFANGKSEALINSLPPTTPGGDPDVVPEPFSLLVWSGLAAAGLIFSRHRCG